DRHHAVDRLETGLYRLFHRLPIDDAGSDTLDRQIFFRDDRPLAIERLAERVDDAAEHGIADGHRDDAPGALHLVAFLDLREVAKEHGTDALLLEIERDAENPARELEHLAGHRPLDAVHARDAVADGDDGADFGDIHVRGKAADLVTNDLGDFVRSNVHACPRRVRVARLAPLRGTRPTLSVSRASWRAAWRCCRRTRCRRYA